MQKYRKHIVWYTMVLAEDKSLYLEHDLVVLLLELDDLHRIEHSEDPEPVSGSVHAPRQRDLVGRVEGLVRRVGEAEVVDRIPLLEVPRRHRQQRLCQLRRR